VRSSIHVFPFPTHFHADPDPVERHRGVPRMPGLAPALARRLAECGTLRRLGRGAVVFGPGVCDGLAILLSGTLRHDQGAALPGHTAFYCARPGRSCLVAATCPVPGALRGTGLAQTDLTALFLAPAEFDGLMASSALFRGLIFRACAHQVATLHDSFWPGRLDRPI